MRDTVLKALKSFMFLILGGFCFWPATAKATEPPRFVLPTQNFDRSVRSGINGRHGRCHELFNSLSPEQLREGLAQWSQISHYSKESLDRLYAVETKLPNSQITYLYFKHKDEAGAFAFIRLFAGETPSGRDIPLVMQRKFPELKIQRAARNFELGLLTKSTQMGDVAGPMLREVLQFLSGDKSLNPHETRLWATARPAQARLYRTFGFEDTGEKTADGMTILSATIEKLEAADRASGAEALPLLSADEYEKIRTESRRYSKDLRDWYKTFWRNEEFLAQSTENESLQWTLQATMRPAQDNVSVSWIIHEHAAETGLRRQNIEEQQDWIRQTRAVAAALVVDDRKSMGLNSSPVLEQIAYHSLDYDHRFRFNECFAENLQSVTCHIGSGFFGFTYNMSLPGQDFGATMSRQIGVEEDQRAVRKALDQGW